MVKASPPTKRSESAAPGIERRRLALRVLATAGTILAVASWFLWLRPAVLGGPASYVSVSGESMEPTYHNGDFVVAGARHSYQPGDVVVFRVPKGEVGEGHHVIHRIIGGSGDLGFIMQGDNRGAPDVWRPTATDVVGKVSFRVPGAGRWLSLLRTPLAVGLFAGMLAFWVAMVPRKNVSARSPAPPLSPAPPPSPRLITRAWSPSPLGLGVIKGPLLPGHSRTRGRARRLGVVHSQDLARLVPEDL